MSVVIQGMEMPKNCKECPLCKWSNHYQIYVCFDGNRYTEMFFDGKYPTESALRSRRADNCQMTELPPHGRLIDGDALFDKMYYADGEPETVSEHINNIVHFMSTLASMPTIIEAEEVSE